MVTNGRVRELQRLLGLGRSLADSARMAEMSEKTARKYRDDDGLPSQQKVARTYRTRSDPFEDVWGEVQQRLEMEPKLKAMTLFEWLQQNHAGRFPDSTRRTFERRVREWRSLRGPGKTVFFGQAQHSLPTLKQAVQRALEIGAIRADALRLIVEHQQEQPVAMFCLDGRPHLKLVRSPQTNVAAYQSLIVGS